MAQQRQGSKQGAASKGSGGPSGSGTAKRRRLSGRQGLRTTSAPAGSRDGSPALAQPSPLPSSTQARPQASPEAEAGAGTAAEASEVAADEAAPSPAAAAKLRRRQQLDQRATQPQQQSRELAAAAAIGELAEAAEAKEAADAQAAEVGAAADSDCSGWRSQGEEDEAEDARPPCGLIASGPGFTLARGGADPPCYRVWLSLQPPTRSDDVTGAAAAGPPLRCARHCIEVVQQQPAASPDGLCAPPLAPLRAHHVVLPEPLDLGRQARCIVTPHGQLYIEAAIQGAC